MAEPRQPQQNKAVAKVPPVVAMLQKNHSHIDQALPRHMNGDRMLRISLTELRSTPKLLACNAKSVFGAIVQSAQLGLEPGGGLGHSYLVPYGKECQLIIGYRGMIDLAYRSGKVDLIDGDIVHANDRFNYQRGTNPHIVHEPAMQDRGELTHVYATAFLKGSDRPVFKVMSIEDVEKIRERSKAKNAGPWKTDYNAMALKTVIRQLFKLLPSSPEMQQAVGLDEQADYSGQANSAYADTVLEGEWSDGSEADDLEKEIGG